MQEQDYQYNHDMSHITPNYKKNDSQNAEYVPKTLHNYQSNQPLTEQEQNQTKLESNETEVEFRLYGDNKTYVYNKLTKQVTSKPTEDTTNALRYLSKYYPPSFGNMFRYVMYKIPLGGTKRKRKRVRRTKHRK